MFACNFPDEFVGHNLWPYFKYNWMAFPTLSKMVRATFFDRSNLAELRAIGANSKIGLICYSLYGGGNRTLKFVGAI